MSLKIPLIWLVIGLIFFILLCFSISCVHRGIKEDRLFRVHEVTVKMVFVDSARLKQIQPGCNAVYFKEYNTFFCLKPESWGDLDRIESIGHDFLHAAGYTHSENFKFGSHEPLRKGDYVDLDKSAHIADYKIKGENENAKLQSRR